MSEHKPSHTLNVYLCYPYWLDLANPVLIHGVGLIGQFQSRQNVLVSQLFLGRIFERASCPPIALLQSRGRIVRTTNFSQLSYVRFFPNSVMLDSYNEQPGPLMPAKWPISVPQRNQQLRISIHTGPADVSGTLYQIWRHA